MKIGDDQSFTVKDIKVNCDETGETSDGWQPLADGILMLNSNGTFVRRLVYLPQAMATELNVSNGWYDDADVANDDYSNCLNNTPLNFGEAVQVTATVGAGAKATFAGQVKESPTVVDVENVMSVANCTPVAIKVSDIIVNCDETGETSDGWQPLADGILMLNSNGTFVRRLVYLPQAMATELNVSNGWYDDADVANDDYTNCWNDKVTFNAASGFQISATAGAGATITIKSALAK